MAEIRALVFCITFLAIFSVLLVTVPVGLQGEGSAGEAVTPLDPSLVTGFVDSVYYNLDNFSAAPAGVEFAYTLETAQYICTYNGAQFYLGAKVLLFGVLWLGGMDSASFKLGSTSRGTSLSWSEIAADADDGSVTYSLMLASGNSAGSLVVYWNSTLYADPEDAFDASVLYLLHGTGVSNDSTNILGLMFGLLFLQLPDMPVLINALLATPVWAAIIYVAWFILKESLPFV